MRKESSLITVSKTIKKLVIILIIIAILLVCWNSYKGFNENKPPIGIKPDNYNYLLPKRLELDFQPAKIESINEVSLYSKEIILQGELPILPEYVYLRDIDIPREDFGTFNYANTVASKFTFTPEDRAFGINKIIWKNKERELIFNREDLSFLYTNQNQAVITPAPKSTDFTTYLNSLGLNLINFDIRNPQIFTSKSGEVYVYSKYVDYIAMQDSSIGRYLNDSKVSSKAEIIDLKSPLGQLYIELKDIEEFSPEEMSTLFFKPLFSTPEKQREGVYKIINVDQAYQEINTYKIMTSDTDQEKVMSSSLINIVLFNKTSYFEPIDLSEIQTFTVNATQTEIGYVLATSNNINYLHPIYIFKGEGQTSSGTGYHFKVYVDALPKI